MGTSFCLKHFLLPLQETKNIWEKSKRATVFALTLENLQNPLQNMGPGHLGHFSIKLGRPVRSMLAQRVEDFEELEKRIPGKKAAEEKYDGERVQIHKDGNEIKAFSRRLENITSQYPDLIEAIRKSVLADKIVLDGEIVAYIEGRRGDESIEEFYSFQKLMQRRRKYEVEKYTEILPCCCILF